MRKVTFSSDSSRKWLSLWLVGENLDRSWQGALLCWRMLGSVSEHHSLEWVTILHYRFTCFAEIGESATRHAILLMDFLCYPDEARPTCCRFFLFTMQWSLSTLSVSCISFSRNQSHLPPPGWGPWYYIAYYWHFILHVLHMLHIWNPNKYYTWYILCIYHVYTMYIPWASIYMAYTLYILLILKFNILVFICILML